MASIYDPELAEGASANDMAREKYALETLGARFATHPLVADNGNAVLAPGCTAQFRMSFAIPELERRSGQTRHALRKGA